MYTHTESPTDEAGDAVSITAPSADSELFRTIKVGVIAPLTPTVFGAMDREIVKLSALPSLDTTYPNVSSPPGARLSVLNYNIEIIMSLVVVLIRSSRDESCRQRTKRRYIVWKATFRYYEGSLFQILILTLTQTLTLTLILILIP